MGGAQVSLARVCFAGIAGSGDADRRSSVAQARATNHAISVGQALALGVCSSRCFRGDLAAAEHYWKCFSTIRQGMRWRAGVPWGLSHHGVARHPARRSQHRVTPAASGFANQARPNVQQFFTFPYGRGVGPCRQSPTGSPRSRRRSAAPSASEDAGALPSGCCSASRRSCSLQGRIREPRRRPKIITSKGLACAPARALSGQLRCVTTSPLLLDQIGPQSFCASRADLQSVT